MRALNYNTPVDSWSSAGVRFLFKDKETDINRPAQEETPAKSISKPSNFGDLGNLGNSGDSRRPFPKPSPSGIISGYQVLILSRWSPGPS